MTSGRFQFYVVQSHTPDLTLLHYYISVLTPGKAHVARRATLENSHKMPSAFLILRVVPFLLLLWQSQLTTSLKYSNNRKKSNSLRIHYPYRIFENEGVDVSNWRFALKRQELTKEYANFSYSQDQEDLWLYENWFYNLHGGVILEASTHDN